MQRVKRLALGTQARGPPRGPRAPAGRAMALHPHAKPAADRPRRSGAPRAPLCITVSADEADAAFSS